LSLFFQQQPRTFLRLFRALLHVRSLRHPALFLDRHFNEGVSLHFHSPLQRRILPRQFAHDPIGCIGQAALTHL